MSAKKRSEKLAEFIKKRRNELGITQLDICRKVDLSIAQVQRLEKVIKSQNHLKPNDPRLSTLVSIAKALQTEITELIEKITR